MTQGYYCLALAENLRSMHMGLSVVRSGKHRYLDLEKQSSVFVRNCMPQIALISVRISVLSITSVHIVLKDLVIFTFPQLISHILWYIELVIVPPHKCICSCAGFGWGSYFSLQ